MTLATETGKRGLNAYLPGPSPHARHAWGVAGGSGWAQRRSSAPRLCAQTAEPVGPPPHGLMNTGYAFFVKTSGWAVGTFWSVLHRDRDAPFHVRVHNPGLSMAPVAAGKRADNQKGEIIPVKPLLLQ